MQSTVCSGVLMLCLFVMPATLARAKPTSLTVVSDATGMPIAGAVVGRLGTGNEPAEPTFVGVTDAKGRLTLDVDPAEWTAFCARASGFAPHAFGFYGAVSKSREVRLETPVVRRGVVLKPDGTPAAGATVEVAYEHLDVGPRMNDHDWPPFGLLLSSRADDAGRFAVEVGALDGWKASALRVRDGGGRVATMDWVLTKVPATAAALDDGSFRIGLAAPTPIRTEKSLWPTAPTTRPAATLTMRLNVVDDETGKAVRSVRVTPGVARLATSGVSLRPNDALSFSDEPVEWTFYDDAWAYVLRVESPGYATTPTHLVKTSEKAAEVELRLRKPVRQVIALKDADGTPAAGAIVYLATPTQGARVPLLEPTPGTARAAATAGADGVVTIDLPGEPCRAAVVHETGWSEIDLTKGGNARRDVTLTRWASVSIAVGNGRPIAGHVSVQTQSFYSSDAGCDINWLGFGTVDARGRFRQPRCRADAPLLVHFGLSKVRPDPEHRLPGDFQIRTSKPLAPGEHRDYGVLGGKGGFKAAVLELPGKTWASASLQRVADGVQAAPAAPVARPRLIPITPRDVRLDVTPRGVIACDGLRPGRYVVEATASAGRDDETPSVATGEFTIAEDEAKVDLGVLAFEGAERPVFAIGDAAPELKSTTLDGRPFDLSGLRGKWVLLDFWGTWCGFCIAEEPAYRDAFEGWGVDGRLAMVSLAVDDSPERVREHLKTHDLPWTHVVLGDRDQTDVPQRFGVEGYPTVMLLSPEGKLVKSGLRAGNIRDTLTKHLGPPSPPTR